MSLSLSIYIYIYTYIYIYIEREREREEPYYTLMYQTDAPLSIKSCFYMPDPDNAPSRMFARDPEVGVALHSRRYLLNYIYIYICLLAYVI